MDCMFHPNELIVLSRRLSRILVVDFFLHLLPPIGHTLHLSCHSSIYTLYFLSTLGYTHT